MYCLTPNLSHVFKELLSFYLFIYLFIYFYNIEIILTMLCFVARWKLLDLWTAVSPISC